MLHHNISTISTNIIICWDISIDDWKSLIDTLGSTSFYMLWLPFEGLKDFTFIIYGTDDKSNKLILTSKAPQNLIVLQTLVVLTNNLANKLNNYFYTNHKLLLQICTIYTHAEDHDS